ncbi:MAG: hypothetical protein GWN67_01215 [Phycisphaerae bacterium]|nr:hypothetical protein [Phycisphaerae bacterium]NIP50577.1 hypothetical protein [Phycisphaerae bacterium]NIS50788.1 hypothetical protein [Phycisphaerae bacterium]NIU07465.1 hypothetical protein [Phycisphaerae bacterium]NIU55055.1 hypothetical protein [Phycisphaerae bacterium]
MKALKIILIIFAAGISAAPVTAGNFTLSDDGLMSLDWFGSSTAILLEKTDVPGPGVRFVIEYQGNQMQDQSFRHISHENHGAGSLTGIDVSIYDYYQIKFTLLSIDGDTNPDTSAVLGVGALIGPYDDHSSAYDPEGLDFAPDPQYGTSAISSTPVRLDNTPSLIGFVAYLPWLEQWSPSGTTVAILVEPVSDAVALPILPAIYYVDADVPAGGDGSSWMRAFNHLLDALAVAKSGDEIRVAQGLYSTGGPPPDIRQASNPNPADGAIGVSRTADLSWTAGSEAISHDVYFGTTSPGIFQGNQTATTFDPGTMAYGTTYYWRIDEINNGSKIIGKVWSFTTLSSPPPMGSNESLDTPVTVPDRTATFQLKNGVIIKGGYAGFGELDPNARNIDKYETILSGDIGIPGNNSDNSYHVVTGSGCDETTILDGFTITAGNANENYPSPHANGGGMYNYYGSPTIINCNFIDNSAKHGGGISSWPGSPVVSDSNFSGNSAELGGAVFNFDSDSTLTNCIFSNNYAELWGGAICSTVILPQEQNNSGSPGKETNIANSIPLFAGYTFSNNSSGYESSLNSEADNSTLTGCTFSGNSAMAGGGVCYIVEGNPSLDNCTFVGNSALIGGGLVNAVSAMTINNCKVSGNSGEYYGGAFYNEAGSATITNCIFSQNTSSFYGGAIHEVMSSTSLHNCLITGNSSSLHGGAMYYWFESSPKMFNCTLAGNSAPVGNAIVCAIPEGGGVVPPSAVIASNCIFWNGGNEIANMDNSIITITYSDVEGGYSGLGNMTADPCFVQPEYFGPIAYWKFDETEGTIAYDSAGSNHGNVHGAQWTTGKVNGALSFDGNNDFVRSQENPVLNNLNAITLQAWIRPRRDAHWHVLDKGDGDKRIYAEGTTLTLDGRVRYTGSHAYARSVSHTLTLNTWQNVALTWSRADNTTRLYHNGVETYYASRTIGTGTPLDDGSHLWTIGARGALGDVTFFDGLIDEAAIYDRVLSPDEIWQNYLSSLYGLAYPDSVKPDYHLLPDSPCINKGDPDYIAAPDETDLDGKPRIIDGRIDMGAYEFNHVPVADAGQDQTVEAQAPWGATVTLDGSGSSDADSTPGTNDDITDFNWYQLDPCDPNADVLLASGVIIDCNLPTGEHIILLEVIDRAGASDTGEVTIIVQDTTPPDINCPQDVILECPADTSPSATGKATAYDACTDVTIRFRNRNIPGCGNTKTIERNWIATDEYGNSSSCVQIITVVDTTPPVITCPADVTLECPADTSVEANGSATAVDTCGTVTVTHSDKWQPGCGNTGILTRTWTATDECGNTSSCVQVITVVDTTPPQFELSVEPTMLWPPDHKMVQITPSWTVSDDCDTSPDVSLVGIVANEGDNTIGDGHTTNDIQINEDGSIYLRSERSGTGNDRIYTITYQVVDDCGNTTVHSATVSIPHDFKVLARIASRWLWAGPGRIPEDLNGDGFVNLADVARFAGNWTK